MMLCFDLNLLLLRLHNLSTNTLVCGRVVVGTVRCGLSNQSCFSLIALSPSLSILSFLGGLPSSVRASDLKPMLVSTTCELRFSLVSSFIYCTSLYSLISDAFAALLHLLCIILSLPTLSLPAACPVRATDRFCVSNSTSCEQFLVPSPRHSSSENM